MNNKLIALSNKTSSSSWRRQLLHLWKLKSMHYSFNINIGISSKTSTAKTQLKLLLKGTSAVNRNEWMGIIKTHLTYFQRNIFASNFWNAVKLSWERRKAVEKAKLGGPFSCNRSHMSYIIKTKLEKVVNKKFKMLNI